MEQDSELISPILEILDRTIHLSVPSWEILDRTIHTQSYPGNIGSHDPYIICNLEKMDRTIQYLSIYIYIY